jgi:hypothetical protein
LQRASKFSFQVFSACASANKRGRDKDNTNRNRFLTPMYANHPIVVHHEQTIQTAQVLPSSGPTDRLTYDPPSSQDRPLSAGSPPHDVLHVNPPNDHLRFCATVAERPYCTLGVNEPSVVLHEDSGVRLDRQGNTTEVPPLYTIQYNER